MKTIQLLLLQIVVLLVLSSSQSFAQSTDTSKIYIIVKNDGSVYQGKILKEDAREVLVETKDLGQVYIPKHEINQINISTPEGLTASADTSTYAVETNDGETYIGQVIFQNDREILLNTKDRGRIYIPKYQIKNMRRIKANEYSAGGEYIPAEVFSTRYFINTNALSIEKGESYIQWNLDGPDFQFGIGKNCGVGIMTSWVGMPIVGSFKYSFPSKGNVHFGAGMLAGTLSWAQPDWGGVLPFGIITAGDRRTNISLSAGYVSLFYDGDSDGRALMSVSGMAKIGKKISLVFDSFIVMKGKTETITEMRYVWDPATSTYVPQPYTYQRQKPGMMLLLPGLRWQTKAKSAFQFGFGGIRIDDEFFPAPIPMVQWYTKL